MKTEKPSAQLPVFSLEWALARLRENAEDRYAMKIKIDLTLRIGKPDGPKEKR
jgi:hypothetical protein